MTSRPDEKAFLFVWREAWATRNSPLTPTQRHVAWVISGHMTGEGKGAFPGFDLLVQETGYERKTVIEAVKRIEASGFLSIERGGGRGNSNRYTATLPQRVNELHPLRTETVYLTARNGVVGTPEVLRSSTPTRDSSQDEESLVPPDAGEQAADREGLRLALTAELGPKRLTRRERGAWEHAISDLLEVEATLADVRERCAAYRALWKNMALTPLALARHWGMLGARVELQAIVPAVDLEPWLSQVCALASMDLRVLLEERGLEPVELEACLARAEELRAERDAADASLRVALGEAAA